MRKFAGCYGQDKMIWGTDYPLLPFQRTAQDGYGCGFSDEATRTILRDNAARVFGEFWNHNASDEIKKLRYFWSQVTCSKKVA